MAVSSEYLATIRQRVRNSSTALDGEITGLINAARADLVLGGVLEVRAADESDPLILQAISTYVKAEFGLDNEDADKYPQEVITETEVFADVQSTKRSEFYAAKQNGIDLAITVKLRAVDYGGQERLSYDGKEYKVERAYTEAREFYELNCSEFREASA